MFLRGPDLLLPLHREDGEQGGLVRSREAEDDLVCSHGGRTCSLLSPRHPGGGLTWSVLLRSRSRSGLHLLLQERGGGGGRALGEEGEQAGEEGSEAEGQGRERARGASCWCRAGVPPWQVAVLDQPPLWRTAGRAIVRKSNPTTCCRVGCS